MIDAKDTVEVSPKRARRRMLLLEHAARQINECGAAGFSLHAVAAETGLSRNAFYYYIEDRNDLIFRCYLRSCAEMSEDIDAAFETGETAAERLGELIRRTLTRRALSAVLSDLDLLEEPQRGTVAELLRRNVGAIARIVSAGCASGEMMPVQAEIAAQCVLGLINWSLLSRIWLGRNDDTATREQLADTIIDLTLHGLAKGEPRPFRCSLRTAQLQVQPINAFDRVQAGQEKERQLIDAASRLFNRRGCDGASLEDIGASVGATKGVVYHYFDSKNQLVTRCYERAFDLFARYKQAAEQAGGNGLDKTLLTVHLNCQAQLGPAPPLMPQPGLFGLPAPVRDHLIAQAQKIWRTSQAFLSEGIADGSTRAMSVPDAAAVGAGLFLWLPKWLPGHGEENPIALADEICLILNRGLLAR